MAFGTTDRMIPSTDHDPAYIYDEETLYFEVSGAVAASVNAGAKVMYKPGEVVGVWLAVHTNTTASTTSIQGDLKIAGTAVCSTAPKITDAASTGTKSTYASGTGITQAVIKTDGSEDFAAGEVMTGELTAAGSTPDGEGYTLTVKVRYYRDDPA